MNTLLKRILQLVGLKLLNSVVNGIMKGIAAFIMSLRTYSDTRLKLEWILRRAFYGV